MSRLTLLSLQLLVAVVFLGLWQLLTTVPMFGRMLLPPFFFSNPVDVGSQIVAWFASGVIWKHLWITLLELSLAFTSARLPACWSDSGSRASPGSRRSSIPM